MSKNIIGSLSWTVFQPQMQAMFDQLNDSVFIIDTKGLILILNQSACKLTGYGYSELIGKPIEAFVFGHPDIADFYLRQKHQPRNSSVPERTEIYQTEILTKNGQKITVVVTHLHFPLIVNKISCIIIRNISERVISDTLREINSKLSSSLNLTAVYDLLLEELHKLIPYDGGNIMLVDKNKVRITRTYGYDAFGEKLSEQVNTLQFEVESTENIKRVILDRKPLVLEDTSKVLYWVFNDVSVNFRSWIGVPIIIDDQVDAIICLDKVEPKFFTDDHTSILSIFANQAASAIKNAKLYEAETRRIQQLDGLQSTLTAINSQLDLNTLLKEIVTRAIKLLHASSGELSLYDPEIDKLRVHVSQNTKHDTTGQLSEIDSGVFGKVATTRKPGRIDFFTDDAEAVASLKFMGVHSAMAVPLLFGKDLLGVLGIADTKANRSFNDNDVALLNTFAQQATIAINNSRLFEDAKRRAEEAETLRKVGAVITSNLDQTQTVNLILEQLALVIPYDIAAVLLQKKDYLTIIGGRGFDNLELMLGKKLMLTENIPAATVYLQKETLKFGNIPEEYPEVNRESGAAAEIKSWLGAPLIIQDRIIGVIFLNSYQADQFTQNHVRLITAFADQVAVALENARLYTDTARSAERFETLYRLSQIISSNLRSEDIYPAVHQAVSNLMPTDFFGISLFDPRTQMVQDVYLFDRGKYLPLSNRPMDKGLNAMVIRNGKSLLFHTFDAAAAKKAGSVSLSALPEIELPQSILIVPLTIGSNRIGVLSAQSYQPNMYTSSDREILELLAANVAIAIENARLFDEVQQLAITDPLTKLYNRRKFEELAIKEFERSRRYHRPLCIIMIDLDRFKEINDSYGHIVGDQVLSGLGSLCRNNLRNVDLLARFGGEEFIILLPETASEEAMSTAERLRLDCAQTEFTSNQGDISLTISLGVVELDETCKDLVELVNRADQALYASKHAGRNTCTLWTTELSHITPTDNHTSIA